MIEQSRDTYRLTVEGPPGAPADDVCRNTAGLFRLLDRLYRSRGGRGLTVKSVHVYEQEPTPPID